MSTFNINLELLLTHLNYYCQILQNALYALWPQVSFALICIFSILAPFYLVALLLHWYYSKETNLNLKRIRNCRRVLLVVAHPDDECLFFGPTVLTLTRRQSCDVHLLCLSSGDRYKKGLERKLELKKSCNVLGILEHNVTIIDHTKLPDDPYLLWNQGIVKDIILRYVEQLGIDTLVSFDEYGVSGHPNHRAVFRAIQLLYDKGKLPVNTQVFVLESVSLFRKYAGLFDVVFSYWSSSYCYISTFSRYLTGVNAMRQHKSQLVWFRLLYLLFSRYMWTNTYRRIAMSENFYKYNGGVKRKVRSSTPT